MLLPEEYSGKCKKLQPKNISEYKNMTMKSLKKAWQLKDTDELSV